MRFASWILGGWAIGILAGCSPADPTAQIVDFCSALVEVNGGSIDTSEHPELQGHVLVLEALLERAPPEIEADLDRLHRTIDGWAQAVTGERSMLDTFELLSADELIGSEGRITDFAAAHCGIDLAGPRWVEAAPPSAADLCPGWPRIGTPLTFNHFPNLPDIAGSNYFAQNFLVSRAARLVGLETLKGAFVVEPGGKVVFHGRYPRARYFAYHPNDMNLDNLKTLRDRDLAPDAGSVNPFREVVDSNESDDYYTATLVFGPTPHEVAPNTSYVGLTKDGTDENRFVVNLLRMYHVDAGDGPGSGGVPLPAVTIHDADGSIVQHFDECELFGPEQPVIRTERVFPALPIIDHRARNPPEWTTSSNFDAPSDTMANADVQYLATHYSERFGDIFVTRAKFLTAPDTRNGESLATPGKQVRLYNLCTYNFWNGGANDCMLENELARDAAGFFTLIVSTAANRPANLAESHATWIDWGPYFDGQLQFRYVYRENPFVVAIAAAADGGPITEALRPYVPVSVPCDRETFEDGGWRACFETNGRETLGYD